MLRWTEHWRFSDVLDHIGPNQGVSGPLCSMTFIDGSNDVYWFQMMFIESDWCLKFNDVLIVCNMHSWSYKLYAGNAFLINQGETGRKSSLSSSSSKSPWLRRQSLRALRWTSLHRWTEVWQHQSQSGHEGRVAMGSRVAGRCWKDQPAVEW